MSIIITRALKDKVAWFFGTILFLVIGALGYTYVLSLENPIKIVRNPITMQTVTDGDDFIVCRTVKYTRQAKVEVGRSLTQVKDGEIHTVSYPSFTVVRKKGMYNICRNLTIPDNIPAGIWTVHTYLDIYTPPFWHTDFEVKQFKIKVIK